VSTYATPAEVRAYVSVETAVLLPKADADLEAMIETAELDVDRQLSARIERDPITGRKLTLADLSAVQVVALSRATAAAVEWRALQGEDDLAEADDGVTEAGGLRTGPMPRPPGPKMIEELAGFGFAWRSGLAGTPAADAEQTESP
jgi:hypothetical protein